MSETTTTPETETGTELKRSIPIAGLAPHFRPTTMGSRVIHLVGTNDPVFRALCGKKPRRATSQPKEGDITCFDCIQRYERGDTMCN
jgi:hypothetical protein